MESLMVHGEGILVLGPVTVARAYALSVQMED